MRHPQLELAHGTKVVVVGSAKLLSAVVRGVSDHEKVQASSRFSCDGTLWQHCFAISRPRTCPF
jgi:hypothetical protein